MRGDHRRVGVSVAAAQGGERGLDAVDCTLRVSLDEVDLSESCRDACRRPLLSLPAKEGLGPIEKGPGLDRAAREPRCLARALGELGLLARS
jgi:hypothetical protein